MKVLCSVCSLLLEKEPLKAHMNDFSCDVCSKKFQVKKYLLLHMKTHKNSLAVECNLCEKKYSSKTNLQKHVLVTHEKVKYSCNFCNTEFSHKNTLKKHMTRYHVDDPLPCTQCDAVFVSNIDLKKHFNKTHLNQCAECHKEFSSKNSLYVHKAQVHVEVKEKYCRFCKNYFQVLNISEIT